MIGRSYRQASMISCRTFFDASDASEAISSTASASRNAFAISVPYAAPPAIPA